LALRLAIWRQEDAHWQVCGILQSNRETCGWEYWYTCLRVCSIFSI